MILGRMAPLPFRTVSRDMMRNYASGRLAHVPPRCLASRPEFSAGLFLSNVAGTQPPYNSAEVSTPYALILGIGGTSPHNSPVVPGLLASILGIDTILFVSADCSAPRSSGHISSLTPQRVTPYAPILGIGGIIFWLHRGGGPLLRVTLAITASSLTPQSTGTLRADSRHRGDFYAVSQAHDSVWRGPRWGYANDCMRPARARRIRAPMMYHLMPGVLRYGPRRCATRPLRAYLPGGGWLAVALVGGLRCPGIG